jgi:hypothetical protein
MQSSGKSCHENDESRSPPSCSASRLRQGFDGATSLEARRSFSEGGKRSIEYPRGLPYEHSYLWNTGSPGPAFAAGFGRATHSRARRSFSEGGKPGDDNQS